MSLYEGWQPQASDSEKLELLKREFLKVMEDKYWRSFKFADAALRCILSGFDFATLSVCEEVERS